MSKRYEFIFHESADSWDKVTASVVETMFIRAENRGYKLKSFKDWLSKQPLPSYTAGRVEAIYTDFCDNK